MPDPAVSILMPVRNEERYLPEALDSLFRQTWTEWELVAVDDGSTDATAVILGEAARRDRRVRVQRSPGTGLVAALNSGLAACRAPLVARMDGDDVAHPRRIERQRRYLEEHPEVGLLATGFRHFPRQHLALGMLAYERWQNSLASHEEVIRDLFVESPFVHPSVMFRKETVTRLGGYREMGWAEDYDLWLRLAAAGCRFARLPEPLLFWRERPERATRTLPAYEAAAFRACKVHHLKQGFLRDLNEVILAGAGKEGRAWNRSLAEQGIRVAFWVDVDPRKVGRILHGAPIREATAVSPRDGRVLATVGTRGAREQLRQWARSAGFEEGENFLCVT